MPPDRSFVDLNHAATERMRALIAALSDEQLLHPVGGHWTLAVTLAHLAFWDLRVLHVLDATERDGKLAPPQIDTVVNDFSLPLLAAIPPRAAARLALETAEKLDKRLETFPPSFLDQIHAHNKRWVIRALHRNEHMDDIDAAMKG